MDAPSMPPLSGASPTDHRTTRRELLRTGTALAAVPLMLGAARGIAGGEAAAAGVPPQPAVPAGPPLADPAGLHPKPPFPAQEQPWPGLAGKMVPKPDHGEQGYQGSGRLQGRRALITGGDSGIGRAAAIAFAREGADVAFNYLPVEEPDAKEVVEVIRASGRTALPLPGDIREEAFCQRLVAEAIAGLGGLDILVNNAGRQQQRASILDLSTEDFDATFKTNVYAMFWLTKAAVPHLPPGSSVINTASEQAYDPDPWLVDYCQTKASIIAFTKAMAKQLAPRGIRVNAVAPGPVWTPLQPSGGTMPEKVPTFGAQSLWKRPGQPVELAPTYVLLASTQASFITAQVYGVTGGKVLI